MRKLISLVALPLALGLSGAAFAFHCPEDMKAIDAKLAAKPALSKDQSDKVAALRKQGEDEHKAGKHTESMKSLGDAKKILGI